MAVERYVKRDVHEAFFRPADKASKRKILTNQTKKKKAKKSRPWTDKERTAWAREHWELHHGHEQRKDSWAEAAPTPDASPRVPSPAGIICRDDAPFTYTDTPDAIATVTIDRIRSTNPFSPSSSVPPTTTNLHWETTTGEALVARYGRWKTYIIGTVNTRSWFCKGAEPQFLPSL